MSGPLNQGADVIFGPAIKMAFHEKRALVAASSVQVAQYFRDFFAEVPTGECDVVTSSGRAMQRLLEVEYDLVVIDSELQAVEAPSEHLFGVPEQSRPAGIELLKFVRRNCSGGRSEVPVLAVVARPNLERVMDARNAGADEIVAVPMTLGSVESRMMAMMTNRRPFVRARGYVGPCRRKPLQRIWGHDERRLGGLQYAPQLPIAVALRAAV